MYENTYIDRQTISFRWFNKKTMILLGLSDKKKKPKTNTTDYFGFSL